VSQPKFIKPADLIEGFGAPAFGAHIFRVEIPASAKADITIIEDYGLKGGERGVPLKETRLVLPRRFWSAIAETARKDFAARLKTKNLPRPQWVVGDNKVERAMGKELCVLAWASEHAKNVSECETIAVRWAALRLEERFWLFKQTAAEAGLAGDKDAGWRKALYYTLSGSKAEDKRPAKVSSPTAELF